MDVSKITAIVELIDTGRAHEASGAQREAVKAYAEAYKGMQDTLGEVHALWVEDYQEMTRQAGPDFESTIPQASAEVASAEAAIATETVTVDAHPDTSISEDESSAESDKSEAGFNVLSVSGRDVAERALSFKSVRANPFAQAAKDLAAAVVEAATDVAAALGGEACAVSLVPVTYTPGLLRRGAREQQAQSSRTASSPADSVSAPSPASSWRKASSRASSSASSAVSAGATAAACSAASTSTGAASSRAASSPSAGGIGFSPLALTGP